MKNKLIVTFISFKSKAFFQNLAIVTADDAVITKILWQYVSCCKAIQGTY